MNLFRKRETLTENITYMAMMAAINVIFSVFSTFVPLGAVFVVIALPLTSAIVAICCKPRYYGIYLVATIGVCLAATAWDIKNTLFYIIPSIITGLTYGLLHKSKIPTSFTVFLVTVIQLALTYVSIVLIKWIYEIEMIDFITEVFGLKDSPIVKLIIPGAIFAYSLAQTSLSHLFMSSELAYMKQTEVEDGKISFLYPFIGLIFIAASLTSVFFKPEAGYVLLVIAIYWTVFSGATIFAPRAHLAVYIFGGSLLIVSFFLFALFYGRMPEHTELILFDMPLAAVCLSVILNNVLLFKKNRKSSRIGEQEEK